MSIVAYLHSNIASNLISPDLRLICAELRFLQILNITILFNPIWAVALNSVRYIDFKGPKSLKNYTWNSCKTSNCHLRLNRASVQKFEENRPPLFLKKWGSVFFIFLIGALLRPPIANQWRVNISSIIFNQPQTYTPVQFIQLG